MSAPQIYGAVRSPWATPTKKFCGSFKLFLPDGTFMPHHECPMAQVVSGQIQEVRNAEVIIERTDGSRVTVVVNIRPLKNGRGEITGAINCFYDVTERQRMERQLQQQAEALTDLHRRKDEFLAVLSHELRNPLAPIANAAQVLRLHIGETALQQQARTVIERQLGQLTRLVDDLLEVSRITTGTIQLRLERVRANDIIEHAIETARPMIEQREHELKVSLSPRPVWLQADASRVEQAVVTRILSRCVKVYVVGPVPSLSLSP